MIIGGHQQPFDDERAVDPIGDVAVAADLVFRPGCDHNMLLQWGESADGDLAHSMNHRITTATSSMSPDLTIVKANPAEVKTR